MGLRKEEILKKEDEEKTENLKNNLVLL